MDVIGWLLVIYTSRGVAVLPTQYPSEAICKASAKAAYVQFHSERYAFHGLEGFICIPGHSPLHGGTKEN